MALKKSSLRLQHRQPFANSTHSSKANNFSPCTAPLLCMASLWYLMETALHAASRLVYLWDMQWHHLVLAEHLPLKVLLLPVFVHEDSNSQSVISCQDIVHQCSLPCIVLVYGSTHSGHVQTDTAAHRTDYLDMKELYLLPSTLL